MRAPLLAAICSVALLAVGASAQTTSFGSSPVMPSPGPAASPPVGTTSTTTPATPDRLGAGGGPGNTHVPQSTVAAPTGINAGRGGGSGGSGGTGTGGGAGGPIKGTAPRTQAPGKPPAIAVSLPEIFGVPGLVSGAPVADAVDARPVNPQFAPLDFSSSEINHATTATNFNAGAINYAAGAIEHHPGEIDHTAGAIDYAGRK